MKKQKTSVPKGMHEIEIAYKRPLFDEMPHISSSSDVDSLMRRIMNLKTIDHSEDMWVLLLNNANRVLVASNVGKGSSTGVVVDCKEVLQLALLTHASGVILVHNHPSGTLKPSVRDRELTNSMMNALKHISIKLLDHLIITSESYFSFADEGIV
jgi:DNA repair protein RadC